MENPNFYNPAEALKPNRITAEMLRRDNESSEARKRILEWNHTISSTGVFVVGMCADSRVILPNPEETIALRSIAVGAINEPAYQQIHSYPRVNGVILIPHFAGPINPGLTPEGCGGAKERKNLEGQDKNFPENSIEWWIKEKLVSHDVIVQSCILGQEIAKQSGKSVLVAPQNHLDGIITPLAFITHDGMRIDSPINQFYLYGQYNPSAIYEFGLPTLPSYVQNSEDYKNYKDFFDRYAIQRFGLVQNYPDLKQMQSKQSPSAIFLSTEIRPFEVRFPNLTDKPGDIFKLHIPRIRIDDHQKAQITLEDLEAILCQMKYPVTRFENIRTIYIETDIISESTHLAGQLMQEPWMKDPIQSGRVKIIVGQVNKEGIIRSILTLNS